MAKFFQNQIFMEKKTEKLKCELARHPEFNLYQAFRMFDQADVGSIDQDTFVHMLIKLTDLQYNSVLMDQAVLIFTRYKLNDLTKMTYTEFCQIFVPQSDLVLQDTLIARKPVGSDLKLSPAALEIF